MPRFKGLDPKKYGRVYIPDGIETKSYLGSHSVGNYGWIFTELVPGDIRGGYVKTR